MEGVLEAVARTRRAQFVPGGVVGVVRPGPVADQPVTEVLPFGVADLDSQHPVEVGTHFEIGSLSKLFTAAVLAWAAHDPRLGVDLGSELRVLTPHAVPDLDGEAITLADLVTHRSGLPRMPMNRARDSWGRAGYGSDQLWAALAATDLLFAPGRSWAYSNFGFGVLGTLLSDLTGRPFGALVDDVVCRPLGLSETALEPDPVRRSSGWTSWWHRGTPAPTDARPTPTATGYRAGSTPVDPVVAPSWNNTGALAGSGGLMSTGADMTDFLAAAAGYGTTSATAILAHTSGHLPARNGPDRPRMGMAWQFRPTPAGPVLFKNGGTSGMHCAMALRPRDVQTGAGSGSGVVVLTNGPDHVDALALELLEMISG